MKLIKRVRNESGQALVETTLVTWFVLLPLFLNAVNFGYFFLMALNLAGSARSSGLYSISGGVTPSAIALPPALISSESAACPSTIPHCSVETLTLQDLTGAVYSPTTSNTGGQVCSPAVGVLNPGTKTQQSQCTTFGLSASYAAADVDPELNAGGTAPNFMLNRVDIAYSFSPPIPTTMFNLFVLAMPGCSKSGNTVICTFYRHTEMRAMN